MMGLTLQQQKSTYLLLSLARLMSPVWVLSCLKQCYSWAALELFLSVCFLKGPGLLVALVGSCSLGVLKTGHHAMTSSVVFTRQAGHTLFLKGSQSHELQGQSGCGLLQHR